MKPFARFLIALLMPLAAQATTVETTRIGHGVKAWYLENPAVPVVHVILSFEGAGSVSDPADKAGLAQLAANMLTEGAGPYDAVGYAQALEDKAIAIDIDTTDDRLVINIHALREQAVAAGQLLAVALSAPHFAADDLARVKGQTRSLLARLEENPGFQATRKFEETAFAGHPYANAHYGTADSIARISAEDLHRYMASYLGKRNVQVTAAGDVDASLLDDMLAPVIDALGEGDAGTQPISKIGMQGAGQDLSVAMDVPQSLIFFAAPGVARDDPRFYDYYMLNEIVGGNALTSRLADGVRQKKGLVYSVNTDIDERAGTSLLRGVMASSTDRAAEAMRTVKAILGDVATRGVTTQECEDARAHVIGGFTLQLDGSRDVADVLMMMRMFHLDADYLEARIQKFRAIKCADVNALAKEILAPGKFLFVTAGAP